MSSILLSNPFVTQPPTAQPAAPEPQTALAVAPSAAAASNPDAGNGRGFGGNGGETGSDRSRQSIIRMAAEAGLTGRAPNATSGSVINAQAQGENAKREGDDPFGVNLPKVEMPDPLPTSPFLTSTKVKDPTELLGGLG